MTGGIRDTIMLFYDLKTEKIDTADDGIVNAKDVTAVFNQRRGNSPMLAS